MKLPTAEQIRLLHQKHAPSNSLFDSVWQHSQVVWKIAEQLLYSSRASCDEKLVRVGILVHDIGVHVLYDKDGRLQGEYIAHGVRGYELLKEEGFSRTICRFASHHTGSGIEKEQIISRKLPLPPEDYLAETTEEKLVMYADKFHSKSGYFNSYEWYEDFIVQFGQTSLDRFRQLAEMFGKPDLAELARRYHQPIRTLPLSQ